MPPIGANEMDRALCRVLGQQTQRFLEEFRKLSGCLFAARVHEFTMLNPAFAGSVSSDFHIVGRIDECELGSFAREEFLERFPSARITAEEPVITKNPQIVGLADDAARNKAWKHVVNGGTASAWRHRVENHLNFWNFKTGRR